MKKVIVLLISISLSLSHASQGATFVLNGKHYEVQVDGGEYHALSDPQDHIFKAFSEMAGPGMESLMILFDQTSWEALSRGDFSGITQYITVAAQTATRGRASGSDLRGLARELETAFKSGETPELTGQAAQIGFSVGAYQNQGVIRNEPHVVASASATSYVNEAGDVVQQATTATLFFEIESTIVNVVVARPSASDEDLERVTEVAERLEIVSARP